MAGGVGLKSHSNLGRASRNHQIQTEVASKTLQQQQKSQLLQKFAQNKDGEDQLSENLSTVRKPVLTVNLLAGRGQQKK